MQYIVKMMDKEYIDKEAVDDVYDYITHFKKTVGMVEGYNVIPSYAVEMIKKVQSIYKVTDDNQLIHFVLSVHPKYGLSPEWMMFYADKIAQLLNEYQIVYGVHTDTDHTHVHFMMNPVSVKSGRVITRTKAEWQIRMICGTLFPD